MAPQGLQHQRMEENLLGFMHVPAGQRGALKHPQANSERAVHTNLCFHRPFLLYFFSFKESFCRSQNLIEEEGVLGAGAGASLPVWLIPLAKTLVRGERFFFTACSTRWTVTQLSVLK